MAHAAPTSHRRGARASHRNHRADGPVQLTTWLGLTFALLLGLALTGRTHVGVHAAGLTLLIMLIPLTLAVYIAALLHGPGSPKAAIITAVALTLALLKLLF